MNISDIIQTGILFITIFALSVVIYYNRKQNKIMINQLKLNFFSEYTKRYQQILLELPSNINSKKFSISKLKPPEKEHTIRYLRSYFDLCSEEYFLWKYKNLDERVWQEWKEGIEFSFSRPAYQEAWEYIDPDSKYYTEFYGWINIIIENQKV